MPLFGLNLSATELRRLRQSLLAWYDANRRALPWRGTRDPYRVWVSEIMLQQTRVAAVLDHYTRFMQRFPSVHALATAREQSVLAVWSGLGYYHRARRMHRAARLIVRQRKGRFPGKAEDWLQLPGIGRYTAAAIASIAFAEPVAVVDGNVERVLRRLIGLFGNREGLWKQANALLHRRRPGDFNQAMMELGATLCTPRTPQCLSCPLKQWCRTRGEEPRTSQPPRSRKQLCYGLVRRGEAVLLVQRDQEARLMAGMWELPQLDVPESLGQPILASFRHSITTTDYDVSVYTASADVVAGAGRWFTLAQWQRLALTGLTRKILRRLGTA